MSLQVGCHTITDTITVIGWEEIVDKPPLGSEMLLKDDTHKDKVRRLFEVLLTTTITPNRDEARCAKEVLLSHLEPRTDDKADIILVLLVAHTDTILAGKMIRRCGVVSVA